MKCGGSGREGARCSSGPHWLPAPSAPRGHFSVAPPPGGGIPGPGMYLRVSGLPALSPPTERTGPSFALPTLPVCMPPRRGRCAASPRHVQQRIFSLPGAVCDAQPPAGFLFSRHSPGGAALLFVAARWCFSEAKVGSRIGHLRCDAMKLLRELS